MPLSWTQRVGNHMVINPDYKVVVEKPQYIFSTIICSHVWSYYFLIIFGCVCFWQSSASSIVYYALLINYYYTYINGHKPTPMLSRRARTPSLCRHGQPRLVALPTGPPRPASVRLSFTFYVLCHYEWHPWMNGLTTFLMSKKKRNGVKRTLSLSRLKKQRKLLFWGVCSSATLKIRSVLGTNLVKTFVNQMIMDTFLGAAKTNNL